MPWELGEGVYPHSLKVYGFGALTLVPLSSTLYAPCAWLTMVATRISAKRTDTVR